MCNVLCVCVFVAIQIKTRYYLFICNRKYYLFVDRNVKPYSPVSIVTVNSGLVRHLLLVNRGGWFLHYV